MLHDQNLVILYAQGETKIDGSLEELDYVFIYYRLILFWMQLGCMFVNSMFANGIVLVIGLFTFGIYTVTEYCSIVDGTNQLSMLYDVHQKCVK